MSKKSKSKFIFTDIHGNFLTFMVLIDKVAKENKVTRQYVIDNMVVCGDLEDRGPRSAQIIQFCIENKIPVVMGNHELMMLDHAMASASHYLKNRWFDHEWTQGAWPTMESYLKKEEDGSGIEKESLDIEMLHEHLKWMEKLPLYIEFKDVFNEDGRYLVISHSQIHNIWNNRGAADDFLKLQKDYDTKYNAMNTKERLEFRKTQEFRTISEKINKAKMRATNFENELVWGRPYKIKDAGGIYNVHGHTPQKDGPRIKKIYSCVDTGCFYKGERGYYQLTCLRFPEMTITTHKNIDNEEVKI